MQICYPGSRGFYCKIKYSRIWIITRNLEFFSLAFFPGLLWNENNNNKYLSGSNAFSSRAFFLFCHCFFFVTSNSSPFCRALLYTISHSLNLRNIAIVGLPILWALWNSISIEFGCSAHHEETRAS